MLCDNPEGWRGWVGAGLQREGIYVYRGVSLGAQLVKSPPAVWETWFDPWAGKLPGTRDLYPLQYSGLENPMDHSSRGRKESDTTERLPLAFTAESLCRAAEANPAVKQLRAQPRSHTPMKKYENTLQTLVFFSVHIQLRLQHPFW